MKVVFLISQLNFGGTERTTEYLSRFFADKDCDVSIVTLSNEVCYTVSDKVKLYKLGVKFEASGVIQRGVHGIQRYYRVLSAIKKIKPNVVICLLPQIARYVIWFKGLIKYKLITSERNNPVVDGNFNLKSKIFIRSDGVIFQTERAQNNYSPEINSTVIPNAIGNQLVYRCTLPEKRRKVISAVGRLVEQKDYPTLIKAFKIVHDSFPEYHLEIYGTGDQLNELIELASELQLENFISFMGVKDDAILRISDTSCYVLSSKYEGMPNALLEAMAVGLPVVSTDCPNGPSELIRQEKNGTLVPVGSFTELAEAIKRYLSDTEFANNCGKEAMKVRETHSIEQNAAAYLDFVRNILKSDD